MARNLHEQKKLYTVLVGSEVKPTALIDINNDFYGVEFFDKFIRPKVTYHFIQQNNGKLFLSMATFREFIAETESVSKGTTYIFEPNGKLKIQEQTFPKGTLIEKSKQIDVVSNWESVPEFGTYDNLLKLERKSS